MGFVVDYGVCDGKNYIDGYVDKGQVVDVGGLVVVELVDYGEGGEEEVEGFVDDGEVD